MRASVVVLAMCMLLTGTINTIATKYQDIIVIGYAPDGTPLTFRHPAVQSACMFLGESLCLIPYFIMRWQRRRRKRLDPAYTPMPAQEKRTRRIGRIMAFAVPTLCDATGTSLMNIGLFYTFASTYQMLRGTLVLFAGAFTVLILRRQLFIHHWLGMVLITAGAALVGASSVLYPNTPSGSSSSNHLAFLSAQQQLLQPATGAAAAAAAAWQAAANATAAGVVVGGSSSGLHYAPGVSRVASRGMLGFGSTTAVGGGTGLSSSSTGDAGGDVLVQPFAAGGGLRPGVVPGLHVWSSALRDGPDTAAAPLFGDLLVVGAQMFTALQFILEEKFLVKYKVPALLAVGLEGCWGLVLCSFLLPVTTLIKGPDGAPLDDAPAAFRAIWSNVELGGAVYLSIFSIAFFNFFGVSVTKSLSGAARATIDACRTLFIWLYALRAGWETFHALEVVGFIVLISGTSLYNEIIKTCLPSPGPSVDISGRQTPTLPRHNRRPRSSGRGGGTSAAAGGGGDGTATTSSLTTPLLAAEEGGKKGAGAGASGAAGGAAAGDSDIAPAAAAGRGRRAPAVPLRRPAPAHTRTAQAEASGASGSWTYHMARSMRLGIHTLSPQSLAAAMGGLGEDEDESDDDGEDDGGETSDIASSSYSSCMASSLSRSVEGGGGGLASSLTPGPGRGSSSSSGGGGGGGDAGGSVRVLRGFEGAGVLPVGGYQGGAGAASGSGRQLGPGGVGGLTASLQAAAGGPSAGRSRLRAASPGAGAAAGGAGTAAGMPPLPHSSSSGSLRRQSSSGNVRSNQQQQQQQ